MRLDELHSQITAMLTWWSTPCHLQGSIRLQPLGHTQLQKVYTNSLLHSASSLNPLTAQVFNLSFHPLEVVCRWRDPQLQVSENCLHLTTGGQLFSNLADWCLVLFPCLNADRQCAKKKYIISTGGLRVEGTHKNKKNKQQITATRPEQHASQWHTVQMKETSFAVCKQVLLNIYCH